MTTFVAICVHWRIDKSETQIEATHKQGKVPIVVGGTSYWIQHLLFPTSLPSKAAPQAKEEWKAEASPELSAAIQSLPVDLLSIYRSLPELPPSAKTEPQAAFALHSLLSHLDPIMARRWHWKDTRKVLRNLNIISEYGRPASEVVVSTHGDQLGPRCRFVL